MAMVLVAHAAVGSALGAAARKQPRGRALLLVGVGALASHVVMDFIPHWDYPFTMNWIIPDVLASIAVFAAVAWWVKSPGIVFWGAFMACIPDLEHLLPGSVFPSHLPWFPHNQAGPLVGGLTQLATMALAFAYVFRLRKRTVSAVSGSR